MSKKYSYSKLEVYDQCPFQYKLRYIDDINPPVESLALTLGTAIHACEENIANAIKSNQEINYAAEKNKLILIDAQLRYKFNQDYTSLDKSDRTTDIKLGSYLSTEIYNLESFMQAHPTYEIVGVEQPFELAFRGEPFKGIIDRVFYDSVENKYIVQDIKTYAVALDKSKLATPLQFVIYTLAAMQLYNCSASQIRCQYYLPFCNLTQDAGTTSYLERGTKKLTELLNNIDAQEFTPKPTALCGWCPFSQYNPNADINYKYMCPYCTRYSKGHKDFSRENLWQGLEQHEVILEAYHRKYNVTTKEVS